MSLIKECLFRALLRREATRSPVRCTSESRHRTASVWLAILDGGYLERSGHPDPRKSAVKKRSGPNPYTFLFLL